MKTIIKNIAVPMLTMLLFQSVNAQLPWPTWLHDAWSADHYDNMVKEYEKIAEYDLADALTVNYMKTVMEERANSLQIAGSPLEGPIRAIVEDFINIDCKNYMWFKYPILPISGAYSNQSMFKNVAIRYRFIQKYNAELQNVRDYLGIKAVGATDILYMPEGKRMLLTLEALQNVINISLEDEEY